MRDQVKDMHKIMDINCLLELANILKTYEHLYMCFVS